MKRLLLPLLAALALPTAVHANFFLDFMGELETLKARKRCEKFEEISYQEFSKKLSNNEIAEWRFATIGIQINTIDGKYILKENKDGSISEYEFDRGKDDALKKLIYQDIYNPQLEILDKKGNKLKETNPSLHFLKYAKMQCK